MYRWYNIMQSQCSDTKRLQMMFMLIIDINYWYNQQLIALDDNMRLTSDINQSRIVDSSFTNSIIKFTSDINSTKKDKSLMLMTRDLHDIRLVNRFIDKFNTTLDEQERTIIAYNYLNSLCNDNFKNMDRCEFIDYLDLYKNKYYKIKKMAEYKLIDVLGLNVYDQTGLLRSAEIKREKERWYK